MKMAAPLAQHTANGLIGIGRACWRLVCYIVTGKDVQKPPR